MADVAETTTEQTDLDHSAAQMRNVARTRALAAQAEKQTRRKRGTTVDGAQPAQPQKAPRRPRRVGPRRVTSPETSLRRAIAEHEREIKRLNRALKAIGAA